jgi:hypothetical protein
VGIINLIEDKLTHIHVGTTVFNNFSKKYETDFNFPGYIENELSNNIQEKCIFTVVKIQPTPIIRENKEHLVSISQPEKKVTLNPNLVSEFEDLSYKYLNFRT